MVGLGTQIERENTTKTREGQQQQLQQFFQMEGRIFASM